MKVILLLLSLQGVVFSVGIGCAQTRHDSLHLQMDELVRPLSDKNLFSGVILAARGDEIVYHESFGYANWELTVPNDRHSRFGIASISKGMTGILLQLLIKRGKLELDMPVEAFIDDFPRGPKGGLPTVGHLYDHRAGIPHRVTSEVEETQYLNARNIVDRIKQSGLLFEPGKKRLYSSAGYTVLARIIELIEKKPFEKVLAELLLEPAAMKSTTGESSRQLMMNRAYPYYLGTDENGLTVVKAPYKDLSFLTGAGSVYTTAVDLFRFIKASRNGALGLDLWGKEAGIDPEEWSGWSGRTGGYEAYLDVLPREGLSLIILTNLRSATTWQIRNQARNLLTNSKLKEIALPPPVTRAFEPAESLRGAYDNNGTPVKIRLVNGKLFRGDSEFYPIAGNSYYLPASGTMMRFERNRSGEVEALVQIRNGKDTSFPRMED